ncbi:MAG: hypothetical protein ACFFCS_20280 [Candidatus Hodarchaeota archaeon]
MARRINVGFLVHKDSGLFALVKHVNLQVNIKAWKIWEDRIDNITRNDIFVYDEEPMVESSAGDINAYYLNGGAVIQLFPAEVEGNPEYIIKDGKLASEDYSELLENVNVDDISGDFTDLNITILKDKGIFVSFSKNIFSEVLIGEFSETIKEEEESMETPLVEGDPKQNLQFFYNLVRYLAQLQEEMDLEREEELRIPTSKVYLFIHGQSLWLSNADVKIEAIIEAVFKDLGIESELPQVFKEPEYRGIDPDNLEKFPRMYYYHRTFREDEEDENIELQNNLAQAFLDQAKRVNVEIRTEKNWESTTVPLFFSDVALLSRKENLNGRTYVVPPMIIAGKTPEMNLKLFQKCLLEPLARKGTDSYLVSVSGPGIEIKNLFPNKTKLKERVLNAGKKILLFHGQELVNRLKDTNIEEVMPFIKESFENGDVFDQALKILIHVKVDRLDLQRKIKDHSFQMKKVDDRMKEKLKRRMVQMQDRLHSYIHISKYRKIFVDEGFKIIEIEDDWQTEDNIKIFLIDQVLPYVMGKKVSELYHVIPKGLEMYLANLCRPLIPYTSIKKFDINI